MFCDLLRGLLRGFVRGALRLQRSLGRLSFFNRACSCRLRRGALLRQGEGFGLCSGTARRSLGRGALAVFALHSLGQSLFIGGTAFFRCGQCLLFGLQARLRLQQGFVFCFGAAARQIGGTAFDRFARQRSAGGVAFGGRLLLRFGERRRVIGYGRRSRCALGPRAACFRRVFDVVEQLAQCGSITL